MNSKIVSYHLEVFMHNWFFLRYLLLREYPEKTWLKIQIDYCLPCCCHCKLGCSS